MNRIILTILLSLPVLASAQEKKAVYNSDPSSWLKTDKGDFIIKIKADNQKRCEPVSLSLVPDLCLMSEKPDTVLSVNQCFHSGEATFNLGELEPGFYKVCLPDTSFNIGVRPEEICSPQDKPEDFDSFWSSTLEELAKVPMNIKKTLVPEHSNEIRRAYYIEVASFGGAVMGGILTEPVAEGKYPVAVEFAGYGGDDYFKDPSSNPETIQFLVSLRDQGIFSKNQDRWIDRGLDSKENFYYRGGFCDVVRALDFVCTLEKADTSRIYCFGQSQGGALTLIAGSLDHRMKLLAPSVPFLNDWKDYAKIVEWPVWEMMEAAEAQGIDKEAMFDMLRYFDVKNFTDRITCPVLMAFGLQDPICPPHTNFAAYNQIKAPKKYMCLYTCGHEAHTFINWLEERSAFLNGVIKP